MFVFERGIDQDLIEAVEKLEGKALARGSARGRMASGREAWWRNEDELFPWSSFLSTLDG